MIKPAFEILNQRGTPMFFSDVFANRPNAGIVGRIFISTDTFAFYRDNGVTWDLIGGPGTGTITGSGTAFKYPVFTNTQEIGDGTIEQLSTKNQSTKDFEVKTSTDDGIYESKLFLTNRFSGNDDTITFQYGKTILAGSPFLKISDNNATFPTSNLYYQGGQFAVNDALLVVTNTLQNNIADFYGVEPVVRINATGVSNNAILNFSASAGTYAGIIRLGNNGNVFQIRTFADVVAFQVNDNTSIRIPNLGGSGNRMVVVDNTGLLSQQAIPTIFGSLATGQVAFGSATNTIAGSNNLFWDNTNARLGIGTNIPSVRVHALLNGNATNGFTGSTIIGQNSSSGNSSYLTLVGAFDANAGIVFTDESAGYRGRIVYSNNNEFMSFWTDLNERMRIFATGNIAVGTTTDAGFKLDVNGTMRVSGASTFTASGGSVKLVTTGDSAIWNEIANSGRTFYLGLDNTAGSSFGVSGASILYSDGARPMAFFTNATERMRLDASGNLGVGVTTVGDKLEVAGNVFAYAFNGIGSLSRYNTTGGIAIAGLAGSGYASISAYSNSSGTGKNLSLQNNGGNVLIGTTTDLGYKLDVNGTMRVIGTSTFDGTILTSTANPFRLRSYVRAENTTNGFLVNDSTDSFNNFQVANNGNVIVHRGSVTIGSVVGTGTGALFAGAATFSSSVTAASYTINDAGNITIGTTTGTKIGTATTQKIGLWNATPIVQPTTAVGSATFNSPGAGTSIKTDDTFDGYTLQQVVKALRDIGILA